LPVSAAARHVHRMLSNSSWSLTRTLLSLKRRISQFEINFFKHCVFPGYVQDNINIHHRIDCIEASCPKGVARHDLNERSREHAGARLVWRPPAVAGAYADPASKPVLAEETSLSYTGCTTWPLKASHFDHLAVCIGLSVRDHRKPYTWT